ncbi:MAG: c-type cytochrome [Proteobacteria bacterium]|nr:c-type cytochrome [Pseudomonadota bacterium]MCP4919840.1 c-type cytochrome [Pseudomonadota bacterium]
MSRVTALVVLLTTFGSAAFAADLHRADQAPGDAAAVEKGKQLFAMCAGCHGADGEGKVGVAPRLNSPNYLAAAPNEFFSETLKTGRTGTNMAAFGASMPDEDVAAITSYIRSWQTEAGLDLDESPLTGSVADGEKIWIDICKTCHGAGGAGYSEAGSGTGIGRADFLNVSSDGFLRAIMKEGKDGTKMRSFSTDSPIAVADLTDEEIDSIIQYLRANAW